MNRFSIIQGAVGAALVLLGMTIVAGWALHNATLTQIFPGLVGMVLNSALCFTLTGAALFSQLSRHPWAPAVQAALGYAVLCFAALTMIEIMSGSDFGIDFAGFHRWLDDHNPRPGRMALNTCIGFIFVGLALVFIQWVRKKWHGLVIIFATFSAMAMGLIGLAAYSLDLELLYSGFHSSRMPLSTAFAMVLTATGLWLSWYRAEWYCSRAHFTEDQKLGITGGATLAVVALTAGIAGFSAHQNALKQALSDHLTALLHHRTALFHAVVLHSMEDTAAISARADLRNVMRVLQDAPESPETLDALHEIGKSILGSSDISGIAVYDMNGREIMEFGEFQKAEETFARFPGDMPASLIWNDRLYLNRRLRIGEGTHSFGYIVIEQALPAITARGAKAEDVGATGELAMCMSQADHLSCFPQYRNEKAFRIPRHDPGGHPLPVVHAIAGKSGIVRGRDYKGRNVIAAYGPVGVPGLGIVAKQDAQEVYKPIRKQLEVTVSLLLLFAALSAWMLRAHVKPLARQLLQSERDAREKELRTRTVVDNVGDGIITLNESGVIESFNNAASQIFGYAQEEAIGQSVCFLIPPGMRDTYEDGMRRYVASVAPPMICKKNIELPALHKDGTVFEIELSVNEIRMGEQRLFVGIVRDITQRKMVERALQVAHVELEDRVQERTAKLQEANDLLKLVIAERKSVENELRNTRDVLTKAQAIAHAGSWEVHLSNGYTEWSDELFRICGIEPQSVKPTLELVFHLMHPDDREEARQSFHQILETGGHCKRELRIVCPDGGVKYILSQAEIIYNDMHEAVSLVGTYLDITEHKLAEQALKQSEDDLRNMAAHQDRIKEDERKRIAREIHDELGALLTGIKSYLSFVVDSAERNGARPDQHVVEASNLADSAIETARRVITELRPSVLDQLGLWAALEWYAEQIGERTGLKCSVEIDAQAALAALDPDRSTAAFRIVQEALTNVIRHANASRVAIRAKREKDSFVIELKDDGIGIEPQSLVKRDSWGIAGMYERARYFGGEIQLSGAMGKGTLMILRMPLGEAHVG